LKVLVTGGAGFIGSNLCERLIKKNGVSVWSLDNYSTGSKKNHIKGVNYLTGSTTEISTIVNLSPDLVFHLGEYSRVEQSFKDFDEVINSNVNGTMEVLKFCKKVGAKLIYSGSSTKFAINDGSNQSPYAWSKANNTQLIKNYSNWYGLEYAIVYFYNVYGKREISTGNYATLIAKFNELMKQGNNLTVVSPGTQKRNFTHIDDIIDGIILVSEFGAGDGYGIGSEKKYSILEIAKMFGGKIEYLPERPGNRMDGILMTEKLTALGWKSTRLIEDYINDLKKDYINL